MSKEDSATETGCAVAEKPAPILIPTNEVCRRLSIGKSLFFRLLSAGQVGPKKIMLGRRVLWNRKEIEDWAAADCVSREKWQQMRAEKNKKARDFH